MATLYIAQIQTYYETLAIADAPDKARRLAGRQALKYLKEAGVTDFKTSNQVLDYFGCNITPCEINGAVTGY